MIQEEKKNNTKPSKLKKNWLKRIGVLGFLFFLIKGIVWLVIFYFGFQFSGC